MRGLIALGVIASLQTQDERVVPVHEEPPHHVVLETSGTRVLDVQIPPGDTTLFHTHSDPILYVTLSTSRTRGQNLGAAWGADASSTPTPAPAKPLHVPTTPPGRMMSTTSYAERAQTHRVNNIGASLFRLIGTTNESPGDENEGPSPGFDSGPEISNRWFRGYRYVLGNGASVKHRHSNPVAIVLAQGSLVVEPERAGGSAVSVAQPGFVAFIEGGVPHVLRGALGDSHIIEVEVRRPRAP